MSEETETIKCDHCGREVEDRDGLFSVHGGDLVCETCLDVHYRFCEVDSEYYPEADVTYFEGLSGLDSMSAHDSYADQHVTRRGYLFYCEDMEKYVHDVNYCMTAAGNRISEHAYYNHDYYTCDDCGEVFNYNDESNSNDNGVYCDSCWESNDHGSESEYLFSYDYKPNPRFFGAGLYMGVELEIETSVGSGEMADSLYNALSSEQDKKCYFKEDGSLSDGIEIVSHPMSFYEHTKFWPDLVKAVRECDSGARSHDVSSCGLHIHVDRRSLDEATINRLSLFMALCQGKIERFSRRSSNQYARFTDSVGFRASKRGFKDNDKYSALNLGHRNTIEFRCYKGTLRVETILATIEFTKLLVEFCKNKHSLNCKIDAGVFWDRFTDTMRPEMSANLLDYFERRGLAITEKQIELIA